MCENGLELTLGCSSKHFHAVARTSRSRGVKSAEALVAIVSIGGGKLGGVQCSGRQCQFSPFRHVGSNTDQVDAPTRQ